MAIMGAEPFCHLLLMSGQSDKDDIILNTPVLLLSKAILSYIESMRPAWDT